MKHIFFIILTLLISITTLYAETTIDFSSDKKEYDIEDMIDLNIGLQTDQVGDIALNIEGIDDFQIISRSKSQNISNINGVQNSNFILNFSILAKKAGKYSIGPVTVGVGTGSIKSEIININITGERIMINPQINSTQNPPQDDEKEEDIDDISLNNTLSQSGSDIEIVPKKIFGVYGEEMNDIYKDMGFLHSYKLLKNILVIISIIIAIIIGFIHGRIYLRKYLESRKIAQEDILEEDVIKKAEIDYQKLVNKLKNKYINSPKELFYSQTGEIYRIYLDDKIQEGLSKGSLQEVQNYFQKTDIEIDFQKKLLNFYTKIYFPEYNNQEDSQDERLNILEDLEKIIIVKEFK